MGDVMPQAHQPLHLCLLAQVPQLPQMETMLRVAKQLMEVLGICMTVILVKSQTLKPMMERTAPEQTQLQTVTLVNGKVVLKVVELVIQVLLKLAPTLPVSLTLPPLLTAV